MNFWKRLFGHAGGDSAAAPQKPIAKRREFDLIADMLTGLPTRAMIASGARVMRRLHPILERHVAKATDLAAFCDALWDAEYAAGLRAEKRNSSRSVACTMTFGHPYYNAINLLAGNMSFASFWQCHEEDIGGEKAMRDQVTQHVSASVLGAYDLFTTITQQDPFPYDFVGSFMKDCARLRALTSEKGLQNSSPISPEWLGDLWPATPKPSAGEMKEQTADSSSPPDNLFVTRLSDHLNRLNALGDPYSSFVRDYLPGEVITILAAAAAEKMALTHADLKEHSFCVSKPPVSYWICTLALSINDAKSWFGRAYGGYSKLLERAWNSTHFRGPGCEVLVHIVYGQTKDTRWVNMAIFPVDSHQFSMKPILPVDLLTDGEMRSPKAGVSQ